MDVSTLAVGVVLGVIIGTIATVCITSGLAAVMLRQMRAHDDHPPRAAAPANRSKVDQVFRGDAPLPRGNRSRGGVQPEKS